MKKPPDKYKCIKLPLHSILHKDDNIINIFNRIQNGCKNIQKIFEYYIKNNERPEKYKRGQTIQKLQTAFELSNCS